MKYQNPQLRQSLAAEYVLGTLRGRARTRFTRLLAGDSALRGEVRFWEQRLGTLGLRLKPLAPRPVVWAAIDYAINASKVTALPPAPGRINLWRVWAVAASLATVGLGFELWQLMSQGPQIVEVPRIVQVAQPTPYVAMLAPGGDTRYVLSLAPHTGMIKAVVTGAQSPVDYGSRCLELWVLDDSGTPHSLGVLPESGEAQWP
jgi:anti-sigma-K factor RskA